MPIISALGVYQERHARGAATCVLAAENRLLRIGHAHYPHMVPAGRGVPGVQIAMVFGRDWGREGVRSDQAQGNRTPVGGKLGPAAHLAGAGLAYTDQ